MGFGIAANTSVFTLVDQVILRTLPVDAAQELVQVTAAGTESYGGGSGDGTELSYAMYKDLRDRNPVFAAMFCRVQTDWPSLAAAARPNRSPAELVSGSFFPAWASGPRSGG